MVCIIGLSAHLQAGHRSPHRAGAQAARQWGLEATLTPLPPERLHITLHTIDGVVDTIPQAVVDAATAAAASVISPPLQITFDHVLSFADSQAFVLRCTPDSDAAIARLRQSLALSLRRAGLRPKPSDTAHMTMLYDHHHIPPHAITPICWTATRFALILSHVGLGHHQWIAQWPLAGHP
jgi:2'-5' RNA ligase